MAEYYRSGLLTFIHVPSEGEEAVRDLLRCRAVISKELKRSKSRVFGFLRRRGEFLEMKARLEFVALRDCTPRFPPGRGKYWFGLPAGSRLQ
jgi:transposase